MADRGAEISTAATVQPAAERGQRLEPRVGRVHDWIFGHTSPWMHHLAGASIPGAALVSGRLAEGHDGSLRFEALTDPRGAPARRPPTLAANTTVTDVPLPSSRRRGGALTHVCPRRTRRVAE